MDNSEKKTDFLIERIQQNENAQSIDINNWAFQKIRGSDDELNILELCCGTGKQTKYLLESFPNARISCLDISAEAISTVKNSFIKDLDRMSFFLTGIDEFFQKNENSFDLIFCSYGLYYSQDIDFVLTSIFQVLNREGRIIVMGPYGENNKQLFDALTGVGVNIPDNVMHSSSTFMQEDVLSFALSNYSSTHIYTTQNCIHWKTVDSVMSYWRSSTFYDEKKENQFQKAIESEININGGFSNNKKIMLLEAIKESGSVQK